MTTCNKQTQCEIQNSNKRDQLDRRISKQICFSKRNNTSTPTTSLEFCSVFSPSLKQPTHPRIHIHSIRNIHKSVCISPPVIITCCFEKQALDDPKIRLDSICQNINRAEETVFATVSTHFDWSNRNVGGQLHYLGKTC